VNASLLEIVNFDGTIKQTRRGAAAPLLMEFQVNPDLSPYLVSSTRSVQWVGSCSQNGTIRAAVRKRDHIESDVVGAVVEMGQRAEWGNVHPLTTEGVAACVDHVSYYELGPVELLTSPDTDLKGVEFPGGAPLVRSEWVPLDAVVAVPVDRGFVGTVGTIGRHKAVCVVHNPSRGIAVAWR
jgi:hypothetical protein